MYLHCDKPVVDHHFFGEKVGSDRSLILRCELFVHILVH